MASAYNSYGTLRSKSNDPDIESPVFGGTNTHQLQPFGGINYQLPTSLLRNGGDTTTINTAGNLTQQERISNIGNNRYEQLAGQQQGMNRLIQQNWQTGLNALSGATAADRNVIFDGWRAAGLLPSANGTTYPGNGGNGIPGSWTSQSAPGSLENRFAAYNAGVYGAANRMNLSAYGIDPTSITSAYQRLMGQG